MAQRFQYGDKVIVPLGTDEVVGMVLEVYGPPDHRWAYIRIPIEGTDGETLDEIEYSIPVSSLQPAA